MSALDPDIMLKAATILRELAKKPREQIHFTADALPVLLSLERLGHISHFPMSNLPEQNIWMITHRGLHWLEVHSL